MNRERWQRLERLFEEASAMDRSRREAFLRDACADDPSLAREVESMIRSEKEGDSWIITPMAQTAADMSALSPGQRIGSYELLREIGRGGMGIVYQARRADQAYDRLVAIKIVGPAPAAVALDERFRNERRILATLDHPHIARLLDGGATESGLPYLVMDYVEGERIDRYCRRHELAVDEVLDLFRLVCDAVEYAHRRLIVHRDLKPANILVTEEETPKLLDFGIAKLLQPGEDAGQTLTLLSGPAFTPDYASPEQVRGEPTSTATDVYSLGAILYELLTGKRIRKIESLDRGHLEETVLQTPIPPPSSEAPAEIRSRLAGDLDTIIMKALAVDPVLRYGSAEQLGEDLRLYRRGLAIKARPPTLGYRARKFIRRRAVPLAATVSVIVILISLTVFYTVRLASERSQARVEAEKAKRISSFLRGLFEMSDPGSERGERVTARELLDLAAGELERGLGDQAEVKAEMTALVGDLYTKLGLYDQAEPLLLRALEIRKELFGDESRPVAESLHLLGRLKLQEEKRSDALPYLRDALGLRERFQGPDHEEVADTLIDLYSALLGVDLEEGKVAVGRAITILEKKTGTDPERRARALEARASLSWNERDIEGALEDYTRVREILEAQLGPDHWKVGQAVGNIGLCHLVSGRTDAARPLLEQSIAIHEKSLGPDHTKVAWALNALASLNRQENRLEEAEVIYKRMAGIYERALGPEANGVGVAQGNLVNLYLQQGRLDEAETAARKALGIFEAGNLPTNVAFGLETLARVYRARERPAAAVPLLERALSLQEEARGPMHPRLAGDLRNLADCYLQLNRPSEAEGPLERLVAILEENDPGGADLTEARLDLAVIAARDGDCPQAVELIDGAGLDEMEETDRATLEACL